MKTERGSAVRRAQCLGILITTTETSCTAAWFSPRLETGTFIRHSRAQTVQPEKKEKRVSASLIYSVVHLTSRKNPTDIEFPRGVRVLDRSVVVFSESGLPCGAGLGEPSFECEDETCWRSVPSPAEFLCLGAFWFLLWANAGFCGALMIKTCRLRSLLFKQIKKWNALGKCLIQEKFFFFNRILCK